MKKQPGRRKGLSRTGTSSEMAFAGHKSADESVAAILADLDQRCNAIEAACNPEKENLHFGPQVLASPEVLEALHGIGLQAWQVVENHESRDASFWFYDWFLVVANVSLQIWRDNTQEDYSEALIRRLALLLVEISQMTMKKDYEGDIQKRHFEALAHVLLAFGESYSLWSKVLNRAQETANEHVMGFVTRTIQAAKRIEREARESRAGANDRGSVGM